MTDIDPWANPPKLEGSRHRSASKSNSESPPNAPLTNPAHLTNAKTRHIPDERRFLYHFVNKEDTLAGIAILYGIAVRPFYLMTRLTMVVYIKQWPHN